MDLYGSLTSPYVRRVRYVLQDLGLPFTLVDVFTDEGQARLRAKNPLWKVPTLDTGAVVLWDSDVILDELIAEHGLGTLRPETDGSRVSEALLRATVDELLGTLIKLFYLRKDGVDTAQVPYLAKDEARARSTLAWIEGQLHGAFCTDVEDFGRSELALYSALDWIDFRNVASLDETPGLRAFLHAHRDRPLLAATAPPR